jgi:hypothetical protein
MFNSLMAFRFGDGVPSPLILAWRIGVSVVLGSAVAGIHRWARRGESGTPAVQVPLVLLAVVAAMAVQLIGDSTARALSVVSALSVARFRADINAQDAVFVLVAIVIGMAAGISCMAVALVGLAVVGLVSLVLWPPRWHSRRDALGEPTAVRIMDPSGHESVVACLPLISTMTAPGRGRSRPGSGSTGCRPA